MADKKVKTLGAFGFKNVTFYKKLKVGKSASLLDIRQIGESGIGRKKNDFPQTGTTPYSTLL